MKRKIALLLGVLVALTLVFAACSNSQTYPSVRWGDNESWTFKISKADFDSTGEAFVSYTQGDETYYRDHFMSASEALAMKNADELRPENISGEYKLNISRASSTQTKLSTTQELYVQYKTSDLNVLGCLDKLSKYIVANGEHPFDVTDGLTTMRSVTNTEVIFANEESQVPVSSMTEVKGFYLGSAHQGESDYKVETVYDFENRKATITRDGGEPYTVKLGVSRGATCIDANQILMYTRSLSKTSNDFKSSPSVAVYNPATETLSTAAFSLTREQSIVLNNDGENFFTTLNAVSVTIGGAPFMMQYNLPDSLALKDLDVGNAISTGTKPSNYTTVRFRVGAYVYEWESYSQDIINGLKKDSIVIAEEKEKLTAFTVESTGSIDLQSKGAIYDFVTVTWKLKDADDDLVKIQDDNKLIVEKIPSTPATVTLVATIKSGNTTDTKEVEVTISSPQ